MTVAIVTGASSGLGAEYVRRIADKGYVDEIWAIARRAGRLSAVKEAVSGCVAVPVPVRILPMDITDKGAMDALRGLLASEKPEVDMLINAAGAGRIGLRGEISREEALAMIRLDCEAAVDMTESVLPYMGKGGRIMEVCSTAAFQPLQGLNVYAASKAFLLRYSRALGAELAGSGIRVTALCPYWIKDTEFISLAGGTGSRAVRGFPLASRRDLVAALSLAAMRLGLPVCTPGIICTLHRIVSVIPDTILMLGWELIRRL